jgi:hypothetical protein
LSIEIEEAKVGRAADIGFSTLADDEEVVCLGSDVGDTLRNIEVRDLYYYCVGVIRVFT